MLNQPGRCAQSAIYAGAGAPWHAPTGDLSDGSTIDPMARPETAGVALAKLPSRGGTKDGVHLGTAGYMKVRLGPRGVGVAQPQPACL